MNTAPRNQSIELSFERLLLLIQDMQAAIARLQQPSASSGGPQQGGGGGQLFEILAANAPSGGIGANSSVTGVTMSQRTGASVITVSTNATVYNDMGKPTAASLAIICSQNADGSFLVVTQSC